MKRLTEAVPGVEQKLALRGKTLNLSKRNLNSDELEFLISIFMSKTLSPAYTQSLNLSYNNLGKLLCFFWFPLETLTCLEVNDNRLSFLPTSMRCLKGLQELDLRNNQLKKLDVVRELPKLRKLFVEGNPLSLKEIRSLMKHVDTTTRTIFVDIAGSVTCICGNKSFPYSSLSFRRRVEIQIGVYSRLSLLNTPTGGGELSRP